MDPVTLTVCIALGILIGIALIPAIPYILLFGIFAGIPALILYFIITFFLGI